MAEKKQKGMLEVEPQKSSAAQFLTYIASTGAGGEKYEIRYENENIWMSQKMLAAVYGVDKRTISYHISKVFNDSELDRNSVVQKYWTTAHGVKANVKAIAEISETGNCGRGATALSGFATASRISALRNSADVDVSKNIGYINAQDRLFMSDYYQYLFALEKEGKTKEGK